MLHIKIKPAIIATVIKKRPFITVILISKLKFLISNKLTLIFIVLFVIDIPVIVTRQNNVITQNTLTPIFNKTSPLKRGSAGTL